MEIEEVDNSMENRICYLMATSDSYIEEIASVYQRGMLDSRYTTAVASLCLAYHKKFKTAPKDNLQQFFENAITLKKLSPDTASEMQVIMRAFANEKAVTDVDFEISESLKFFQSKAIQLVSEEAQALIKKGEIDEAKNLLTALENFDRSKLDGCDVYALDDDEVDTAVNDTYEQLIEMPQAVGKIMNNTLVRGGFVALIARMKAGKTYWLTELARYARNQNRKVIFFSAGDMTKNQMLMRIWQADAKTTSNRHYQKNQRIPYLDCKKNQTGMCFEREGDGDLLNEWKEVHPYITSDVYEPCCACKDSKDKKFEQAISYKKVERPLLTPETVKKLRDEWRESGRTGILHVEHAPSGTLTCAMRRSRIRAICKKYGWTNPDVILYDYAGLMANEKKDERESTHFIWQSMRAEADPEMFDCLVVTAMQANSTSFDFEDLTIRSFSLDKRCFDEVSAAYALNQIPEERKEGITRIAALLKREHPFDERMQAECHGCLSLGTPHIMSTIVYKDPPKPTKFGK